MTCRIPTYDCIFLLGMVDVNVKSAKGEHCIVLRWGVAYVGITLLGMAHPIRDNISGTGHASMGGSHSGMRE